MSNISDVARGGTILVKTFIIKKRGRKWFECLLGGWTSKLNINEVSGGLEVGNVVKCEVEDKSKHTDYGSSLEFHPLNVLRVDDGEALKENAYLFRRGMNGLERQLKHVRDGKIFISSIGDTLTACKKLLDSREEGEILSQVKRMQQLQGKCDELIAEIETVKTRIIYLDVPFEWKSRAKEIGALWNPSAGKWYVVGKVPAALAQFSPTSP